MEAYYYGEFISEDSIIRLTDGREMKGKYEVSKGILECCDIYHKEHVNNFKLRFIKYGLLPAALGGIAGIVIYKVIDCKQKNITNK